MDRSRFRAFTLVELLVVILIICLLIAMLMPALTSAWQLAEMTQCKTNLATLYKAQGVWSADHETPSTILAGGWAGSILPYLENRPAALKCPSCPKVGSGSSDAQGDGSVPTEGDPYAEGTFPGQAIELQDVTIGVLSGAGQLLYEIPLSDSPYWDMYEEKTLADGRKMIGANLDDNYSMDANGWYTDTDFVFYVEYRNGKPYKVTIGDCDSNGGTIGSDRTDMRVNHKPIWNGQLFYTVFGEGHQGETIDLYTEAANNGTLRPSWNAWTAWFSSTGVLGATNYGISRGSCLDKTGRIVPNPDPKLFFILDYPRPIADYTDIGDKVPDKDFWTRIFISPAPLAGWVPPPGLEEYTWQEVQALRHFGKANVLFCDGHIESLGPEDLMYNSPLWRYGAR